ncbi:MAG: 2-amino-4-hydroxy-6-hydroxymethyldihydropteridine diphosphokinase [Planctomycetota bacterium]
MLERAIVALGSNVGDRLAHLRAAVSAVRELPGVLGVKTSALYETPALTLDGLGSIDGDDAFLNAAVAFETRLDPHALLAELLGLETRLGRIPRSRRATWAPRPIDLDLLVHGDRHIDDDTLTLPHPRITERWFVLAPLADLAPSLRLRPSARVANDEPKEDEPARTVRDWLGAIRADPRQAASVGRIYADASWASASLG